MNAPRLKQVVYELPAVSRNAQQFFAALARILEGVEGSVLGGGQVTVAQHDPPGLLPATVFRVANSAYPAVLFDLNQPFALKLEHLILRTPAAAVDPPATAERDGPLVEDALGMYVQLPAGSEDFTSLLPLETVYKRLKDHVLRLDHTGVNLPVRLLDRDGWDTLVAVLAAAANMYRYPTGEEWPFIIPATAGEFAADIVERAPVRKPKFELVYDATLRHPLIQIDIETDLTRAEIEALFPEPYGVGLTGLDQYFRSVYVYHPWPGLSFRVDMGYLSDAPGDMAGWLVHEGGRIGVGG
jgi:hypothetical protein